MLFSNITREKFTAIQAKVQQETGDNISGDVGQVEDRGFVLSWKYTEHSQTLMIACNKQPWWCPDSMVASALTKLVTEA